MAAEKNVSISFRVTPEFKALLERAAAHEQRSQTNLLEKLLFDYSRTQGLSATTTATREFEKEGVQ